MINRLTLNLRSRLVPSTAITSSYAQNSSPIWTFARFRRPADDSHHGVLTDTISIPNTEDIEGETLDDIYMDNLAKKSSGSFILDPPSRNIGHRHPDEQDESEDLGLGSSRGQDTLK